EFRGFGGSTSSFPAAVQWELPLLVCYFSSFLSSVLTNSDEGNEVKMPTGPRSASGSSQESIRCSFSFLRTSPKTSSVFLRSPLLFHERRPSERANSVRDYPPLAAKRKTQVRPNSVVSSSFQRSPLIVAGKVSFLNPFLPLFGHCNSVDALWQFFDKMDVLYFSVTYLFSPGVGACLSCHGVKLLFAIGLNKLHVPIMASSNPPSIIRDHLYSIDDRLKRGRPPPLLKGADEDIIIDEEPPPEAIPVIDPASISRCCIEKGLFPAVPLFFQYPCSTSKGWSEWVDHELKNPSTRDILSRAGVLEAIFASKACDIHIEAKTLRHLVRRWNPFRISLTPEDGLKLETLRKGAPTSPSTSLRFNCLHGRVFPLALAIARGSMIPLAPMFLGHLYRLLDQIQFLEKGAAGTMAVETFTNSSFLQIFLWERFKGIEVSPLPYSKAESLVASDENSYVPGSLPLICRWFRRMQRKGQNFLELLDDVEKFIFRPYCVL
ncbi:unnamed protein product, partial [Prunus brigantina]